MSLFNRNKSWSKFEVFNDKELPNVDESTYYEMKVAMNDNGHVKIKTALKEPGKEWDIQSKEYHQEKPAIDQSQKKTEAIDETKSKGTESSSKENLEAKKGEVTSKESKKERGELSRKHFAPFEEIHGLFRNIEKDFENSIRKNFDLFDGRYESQAETSKESEQGRGKDSSPFDEMDAIFQSMQRDFEKKFGDTSDRSWRGNVLDHTRPTEDELIGEKESKEKKESKEGKEAEKSA